MLARSRIPLRLYTLHPTPYTFLRQFLSIILSILDVFYNNNLDNIIQQLAPESTPSGAHGNIIPCRGRKLIAAECCWFMLLWLLSNISVPLHFYTIPCTFEEKEVVRSRNADHTQRRSRYFQNIARFICVCAFFVVPLQANSKKRL